MVIRGRGFGHVGTLWFGSRVVTSYTIVSDTKMYVTTPPGHGEVVVADLQLGEALAERALSTLRYTYSGPSPRPEPPTTAQTALTWVSASSAVNLTSPKGPLGAGPLAEADHASGGPSLIPNSVVASLRHKGELEIDYGALLSALAGIASAAPSISPALAAFLIANPEVVAGLALAAAVVVLFGLALKYGPGFLNALIDPSGNVVDTNGNAVAGATVSILTSPFSTGPFSSVKANSSGIEPRANPETANRAGGFHWDVAAGYYEVQASAPNCHGPGTEATTVTSPVFPIPPPKVGLTLVLACSGERPVAKPTVGSVSPTAGAARGGTKVTVDGTGFDRSATVRFGLVTATSVTYLSPEALSVVVPAGSGSRDVRVSTVGGTSAASVADRYTYYQPPTVKSLSAAKAPAAGGDVVRIDGAGFGLATGVYFGRAAAPAWSVVNNSEIEATAPAGRPGPVDVTVSSLWGRSSVTPSGPLHLYCADGGPAAVLGPPTIQGPGSHIEQEEPECLLVCSTERRRDDTAAVAELVVSTVHGNRQLAGPQKVRSATPTTGRTPAVHELEAGAAKASGAP